MNDEQLIVRWYPPYSNNYKKQPVSSMIEAQKMVDWFRSINVSAEIVTINKIEVIELY